MSMGTNILALLNKQRTAGSVPLGSVIKRAGLGINTVHYWKKNPAIMKRSSVERLHEGIGKMIQELEEFQRGVAAALEQKE